MKPGKDDDAIVAVGSDAAYVDGLLQSLSDNAEETLAFLPPMWRCEQRLIGGGSPEGWRGSLSRDFPDSDVGMGITLSGAFPLRPV